LPQKGFHVLAMPTRGEGIEHNRILIHNFSSGPHRWRFF
jgi:hypothetical protein